jgi:cytochrome c oxidase subunit 2
MRVAQWVLVPALALLVAAADAQVPPQQKVIVVTAEKFKFTPATIRLKLGEPVVLELTSLDRKHGFTVPDLNIDESIEAGKTTRVQIVPQKAGTFPFHCDVFCGSGHEEMAGEIVVMP